MVSRGVKCIKYLLFLCNLVLFIVGLLLIVAGTLVQTRFNEEFAFFEGSPVNYVAMLLIAVGLITFVIGYFGCCGAYRENRCLIFTFAMLLGLVFFAEIAGGITAHVMRNKIDSLIREAMLKSSDAYPGGKAVQESWDHAQRDMRCCGVNNYTDWAFNRNLQGSVPDSCCLPDSYKELCGEDILKPGGNTTAVFHEGCADSMMKLSSLAIIIILSVFIGVTQLQILGIVLACCLAADVHKGYEPV